MRRNELLSEQREVTSRQIVQQLLSSSYYKQAEVVFAFAPFRQEVELDSFIEACWSDGKHVYLPRVDAEHKVMQFYRINSWSDLVQGHYGIREPKLECVPHSGAAIDLMIMPGAAFDRAKRRLGYGAGYYDRFLRELENKPYLIAPAYAMQIVAKVPTDEWDHPVDAILTEEGWIL